MRAVLMESLDVKDRKYQEFEENAIKMAE